MATANASHHPPHPVPRRRRQTMPAGRFHERRHADSGKLPPLQFDLPGELPVTDTEIDLVLGLLGATIAAILRDDT